MDARSILSVPSVYRGFVRIIGNHYRAVYVADYVRPRPGDRVLDIGCGPGDIVDYLGNVDYVGIDISEQYVRAATARFGTRGRFVCKAVKDMALDEPGSYDLVLANGLLHHLDDAEAVNLFQLAHGLLKPGGRLVTFDGCFVEHQSVLARCMLRLDRGKFVRRTDEYLRLATQVFPQPRVSIRHDLLRIPYTHIILECTSAAGVNEDHRPLP